MSKDDTFVSLGNKSKMKDDRMLVIMMTKRGGERRGSDREGRMGTSACLLHHFSLCCFEGGV